MSSALNRLNGLSTVATYALTAVALTAFVTTNWLPMTANPKFNIGKAIVKNIQEFETRSSRNDVVSLTFDLEVDTGPLWNWNTKMLYMYLVAEYKTDKNDLNQVTVWDKIVQRHQIQKLGHGLLKYKSQRNKYYFFDDGAGLLGNPNITMYLCWNVIPNIGYFWLVETEGRFEYSMPDRYGVNEYYNKV